MTIRPRQRFDYADPTAAEAQHSANLFVFGNHFLCTFLCNSITPCCETAQSCTEYGSSGKLASFWGAQAGFEDPNHCAQSKPAIRSGIHEFKLFGELGELARWSSFSVKSASDLFGRNQKQSKDL